MADTKMHISFVAADSPNVSGCAVSFLNVHWNESGAPPFTGFGGMKSAGLGSSHCIVWNTVSAPMVAVKSTPCLCMWLPALMRFMSKGTTQLCVTTPVEFGG